LTTLVALRFGPTGVVGRPAVIEVALSILGVAVTVGDQWSRRPRLEPSERRFISAHWREGRLLRMTLAVGMAVVITVPLLVLSSLSQGQRSSANATISMNELAMQHAGVVCMKTAQAKRPSDSTGRSV
jgi:hypothetical protein